MTIKEKAKAYDKFVEELKSKFKDFQVIIYSKNDLKKFFQELAESEDERIKKSLINYFEDFSLDTFAGLNPKSIIAWLKKQGEKSSDKIVEKARTEKQRVLLTETDGSANIDWDCRSLDDVKLLLEYGLDYIKKLEKQGEQKHTDKVEPKFKIGDWVIDKQDIVHQIANVIENVTNHTYGYDIVGGGYFNDNTEGVRLWTINDAKDGDVLAAHECIVLFKEIDGLNIKCHCTYHFMNNPSFYVNTLQNKSAFHPATKEQRDLLFTKMKEASYEWDAERKKLKKIERDLTEFENTLADVCRGWIGEELGWKDYIIKNSFPLLELAKKQFDKYERLFLSRI